MNKQITAVLRREGNLHSTGLNCIAIASSLVTAVSSQLSAYSCAQSGSSGCLRSQSGRRLRTVGNVSKLYSGGGEVVVHSSVHASHGSSPASFPLRHDMRRLATRHSNPAA